MSESKNILLAEDDRNEAERALVALAERKLDAKVEVVRDGAEALDYLFRRGKFTARQSADPVLVLLDLKMPKLNGLEVLQKIKADEKLKTVPVVALTSSRESPGGKQFYDYVAKARDVKSVGFPNFINALSQLGLFWGIINQPPLDSGLLSHAPASQIVNSRAGEETSREIFRVGERPSGRLPRRSRRLARKQRSGPATGRSFNPSRAPALDQAGTTALVAPGPKR